MRLIKYSLLLIVFLYISCGTPQKKDFENPIIKNKKEDDLLKIQFDWAKCEECFVEIQKPSDWKFHKIVNPNGFEYYLTPYLFEDLNLFKRGLSLVVMTSLKKSTGLTPSQKVDQFINNAKTIDPKLNVKKTDMQELQGSSFLLKDPIGTPDSLISSIFLIANDSTDTLYTFVFQYEKKDWDLMQPISGQMLKNLKVSKAF